MLVLGLQGSPRLKGNTSYLLSAFMEAAQKLGARTITIDVTKKNILPCKELIVCEKKGFCPIDDDMKHEVYSLLRRAEIIVPASPIFFYNVTAQLKALIDRSQTLWARKYRMRLSDPLKKQRKGFFLSVGATGGKQLFDGVDLTMRYFFDALDAQYAGGLTYKKIEHRGDMEKHPDVLKDVQKAVDDLVGPLAARKRVLFVCRDNTRLSQMAGAFAAIAGGDRIDVCTAGIEPGQKIDPIMAESMEQLKIDLKFFPTRDLSQALSEHDPEQIILLEKNLPVPELAGKMVQNWSIPEAKQLEPEPTPEHMARLRDTVQEKISSWIETL